MSLMSTYPFSCKMEALEISEHLAVLKIFSSVVSFLNKGFNARLFHTDVERIKHKQGLD